MDDLLGVFTPSLHVSTKASQLQPHSLASYGTSSSHGPSSAWAGANRMFLLPKADASGSGLGHGGVVRYAPALLTPSNREAVQRLGARGHYNSTPSQTWARTSRGERIKSGRPACQAAKAMTHTAV